MAKPQSQLSLFGADEAEGSSSRRSAPFDPATLPVPEKRGPERVRFGTSSWTYPGWSGTVYGDVAAYGAASRFEKLSLSEYVRDARFRTVGADNLYYAPPAQRLAMLTRFRDQLRAVPGFDLCPKVWHGVTVHRYSEQQQQKWRVTGEINRHFLDADLFLDAVLLPLQEVLGPALGPLILEIQENELAPHAFAQALDRFLTAARSRASFRLVVELRTFAHLCDRYLDVLSAHGASHCLNSWTRMPPIAWQHERVLSRGASGDFALIRALLRPGALARAGDRVRPGNSYEEAVRAFAPYDRLQQPQPDVRADILRVIRESPGDIYVIVNNRLEGHSPTTIAELQAALN